ncbi:MAG: aminopeptidase P family protein [Verrucomicrobia bacterium]|nr:aminopeptidase P family protein [Verrucomicrobiota bacterium]
MKKPDLLIVGDSERDANLLYVIGAFLPDPVVYLRARGRSHLIVGDLDVARAQKAAPRCKVLPLGSCLNRAANGGRKLPVTLAEVIRTFVRERKAGRLLVPDDFPLGLARDLRDLKVRLKVKPGPLFFPEREYKTADEVKKISAAQLMAEVGMAEGIQALRLSKINPQGRLLYRGSPLTSQRLRAVIESAVVQAGGLACRTIVACGRQAYDPHQIGHGPLRAHEPIVIDIFPRSQRTGYHGDITRTVVRGRASEGLRQMYAAVLRAQRRAEALMRPGVRARDLHGAVDRALAEGGFPTCRNNGRLRGFLHGAGHGIGLELHEPPRITASSPSVLAEDHVLAIEPGLYYPQVGGVRLEDVYHLARSGPRNLTKFEKVLEV